MKNKKYWLGAALVAALIGFSSYQALKNPNTQLHKKAVSVVRELKERVKKQGKTTWDIYGENIIYEDFHDIDFNSIPYEEIQKPSDLKEHSESRVKDRGLMDKLILEKANKLGYSYENLKNISAREAIKLSADIAAFGLEYFYVDNDKDFLQKNGAFLPIERYLEIGLGDCDKYSRITSEAFRFIKDINPKLKNIYDMQQELVGFAIPHAWNSFVFLTKDKIIVTQIDPTEYDNNGELEATDGFHLNEDKLHVLSKFYYGIYDFEHSYHLYKRLLDRTETFLYNAEDETIKKILYDDVNEILKEMEYIAGVFLKDREKMNFVEEEYFRLGSNAKNLENRIYCWYFLEKESGNKAEAKKHLDELSGKFPNSYWLKVLNDSPNSEKN